MYLCMYTQENFHFFFRTKPLSDICVCQNSGFANICDRLNKLGDSVDNARTVQKDVMNLVDQTTKIFQEKFLNIDESLKQGIIQYNVTCCCLPIYAYLYKSIKMLRNHS